MLAIAVYTFMGRDLRPVHKAYESNMLAILLVVTFGIFILVASFLVGAGTNIMTVSFSVVMRSLWERGSIIFFGELIRYKLIKNSDIQERMGIIFALTITLAYGHMNALHLLFNGNAIVLAVFFESVFKPIVISVAASFFAVKGSFISVITISFAYTMSPYLLPILPAITPLTMSLAICGLAFLSAVICHFILNRNAQQTCEKRAAKYEKRHGYIVTTLVISIIAAFFTGMLPFYPIVVLTSSMTGAFDRGSMVFIERVPQGEAFVRISKGDVIHFTSHGGVEYIHRVIDFTYGIDGDRKYITKGDANDFPDPFPVAQKDVLGIAHTFLPFIGYPHIFIRDVTRPFG